MRVAQLIHRAKRGVKRDQEWELDDGGKASGELVDVFALHHLGYFFLLVMLARVSELEAFVALVDGFELGRDLLLQQRGLHAGVAQREQRKIDDDGEQTNGPSPVLDPMVVRPVQPEEKWLSDEREHAEVNDRAE